MAIKFPDSPTQGDTHVSDNGVVYTFENGGWTANPQNITNLNSGPLAKNQLINGAVNINQRDNGGVSTGGYTVDRWYASPAANRTGMSTRSLGQFANTMLCASGAAITLIQPIETPGVGNRGVFQPNTTWTISFWTSANVTDVAVLQVGMFHGESITNTNLVDITGENLATVSVLTGQNLTDNTGAIYQRVSYTFTLNSSVSATGDAVQLRIQFGSLTADARSTGFQLEAGPVATVFEHRPIATETALCQRYYQTLTPGTNFIAYPSLDGDANRYFRAPRPVIMRRAPDETATTSAGIVANAGAEDWMKLTVTGVTASGQATITGYTADAEL